MRAGKNDNKADVLDEVLTQFVNAYVQGEQSDVEEFIERFPQYEAQIRRRIGGLRQIDALFDSLVQADENDFVDTSAEHNLVGQKIGGFEIVEMIGRGGMGVVYLARDTRLKRSVAIKSMPPQWKNSTARTRFRREAELLASLNHPNIAVIHDIIEQEDHSGYLVLEYVPGKTLAERMKRESLTMDEVLSIGRQIAKAISAAHKKHVVHRDLKPGNIKITPEGQVKVLDFGLAKPFTKEDKKSEITETQPGRVIGTPAYMSPEQARGDETDHRTDIWSFGCVMYQMLTAQLPFEGQTATDTLARIIEREPDWELLPQDTPANIRTLLRRCLEKDANKRLGNIEDATIEISETLSNPQSASTVKLRRIAMILSTAIIIVLLAIALRFLPEKQAQPSSKEIRLVVLHFENLGPAEDEYFATGIMDEIATRLAGIHGLRVFKSREEGAKQIAKELGVDYILEGTLQRARRSDPNSPMRIRPQLTRASDDSLVWMQTYFDVRDVLQIQSDLVEKLVQALDITLLEQERQALQSEPTTSKEAFLYYQRGNEYFYRGYLEDDLRNAIRLYQKAVEFDSNFALAYAQLTRAHSRMYWFRYDRSEERHEETKDAIDKAFKIDPDLPEVRLALGQYYYHCHRDYDRALEEFAIARESKPNDSELLSMICFVQRQQGKYERALDNIKKAYEFNPLSNSIASEAGTTCFDLRNYQDAELYYQQAISLAPDMYNNYFFKAKLYLSWEGTTDKARAVLEEALQNARGAEYPFIVNLLVNIEVYDGNYQEALTRLSSWTSESFDAHFFFIPKALLYAQINGLMGNRQLEQSYYESARSILETKVEEDSNDVRFHSSLGIAYAGLGRKEEAIREGKRSSIKNLAHIYVMVEEFDAAIDQLTFLLSIPSEVSIPLLRLDPAWDPLHKHPRFKKLLELDN